MATAEIKPHAAAKYTYKQSRFANIPELPLRAVLVAPSGGGKTTLLVSLILDVYRNCWRRIYVFSPTALLDDAWRPISDFCEDTLRQEEPCLYDRYSEDALQGLIDKHHRITAMAKKTWGYALAWSVVHKLMTLRTAHRSYKEARVSTSFT